MFAGLLPCRPGLSAEWNPSLSVNSGVTLSDNVVLSSSNPQTGFILRVSPSIGLNKDGARLKVQGSYTPSLVAYVPATREGQIFNVLRGTASLEAVENFFFIDARAAMTQTFSSPFGPQPDNLGNVTANRLQATTLGISPYIRGRLAGGSQYLLRGDINYSMFSNSSQPNILNQGVTATWDGVDRTLIVPSASYNLNSVSFGSQQPFVFQTLRARGTVNFDPEIQVFANIGYETNDFVFTQQEGPIYGMGFNWKPSPRTTVSANAEHRFFGWSYNLNAAYRTALTAWTLQAGRQIQTSQQQYQQLGTAGARSTLDSLLAASIPDPVQREAAIDQILAQGGLGTLFGGPTPLYAPRILLVENVTPSFAILGSRSSITFSAFWRETTPLSDAVAPPGTQDAFANLSAIAQRGGSIAATHKLDPMLTATASVSRIMTLGRPTASASEPTTTVQNIFLVGLSRQIDANMFGTIGLRSQTFNSNGPLGDYRERAIITSLTYVFF